MRPIVPEDVPAVQALIAEIFREYGCTLNLEEDAHLRDPGGYFRSRGGEFWVVEEEGRVVGTVAVVVDGASAELRSLYVRRSHRRCGLGRTLTEHVMSYARKRGCGDILLWSDTRFVAAHRLYESLGFKRTGETRELHDSNDTMEYRFGRGLNKDV